MPDHSTQPSTQPSPGHPGDEPLDGLPHAPATRRNRDPILAVLSRVLPEEGLVLEIASGTGEHIAWFAGRLPRLTWQPSEPDPELHAAVASRVSGANLPNLRPPLSIRAESADWGVDRADAVLAFNMTQVSPWAATEGLFAGAARVLAPGGALVIYGPFRRAGRHTAASNAAFDAGLKRRDPAWGVRDTEALDALAAANGLDPDELVEMPANNLTIVYRRR